jgi:ATP-dependent phosphofructokinase / diphosphate-dependent phosphofructokinase
VRVGILTGGGDCPGLNPAIRGAVMRLAEYGIETVGLSRGWLGLVEGLTQPLNPDVVEEIIYQGGTMLYSSRTNPFKDEKLLAKALANIEKLGLDALIALGGEDTLGVASKLFDLGIKTVGVPKTMDNDLSHTDYTFGFDSAVSVAVDAVDRLRDTARSHQRTIVLEVMGRHAGWVALNTGIAGGADWILIPEVKPDLDEMCKHLINVRTRGKVYSIVVASEGIELPKEGNEEEVLDSFGHMILRARGVGDYLAKEIETRTGFETRFAVLGHILRGGAPTPFDRVLASRLGIKAAEMVKAGHFGKMASLQGNAIVEVDLKAAVSELKTVPIELYEEAKVLFSR